MIILALPLLAVLFALATRPDARSSDNAPSVVLPAPTGLAPDAAVAEVHAALHAIGHTCRDRGQAPPTTAIAAEVDTILRFAERYPNVSFRIDDESGSTLALLFVVQDVVGRCAPSLLAKVQAALPPQYRRDA